MWCVGFCLFLCFCLQLNSIAVLPSLSPSSEFQKRCPWPVILFQMALRHGHALYSSTMLSVIQTAADLVVDGECVGIWVADIYQHLNWVYRIEYAASAVSWRTEQNRAFWCCGPKVKRVIYYVNLNMTNVCCNYVNLFLLLYTVCEPNPDMYRWHEECAWINLVRPAISAH